MPFTECASRAKVSLCLQCCSDTPGHLQHRALLSRDPESLLTFGIATILVIKELSAHLRFVINQSFITTVHPTSRTGETE